MKEEKLLPCPFCGREAEIVRRETVEKGKYKRAYFTPRCTSTYCCGRLTRRFTCKELAAYAWNRRAKPVN